MTKFMQGQLLRGKLDLAPLAKSNVRSDDLPKVAAPSLDDLAVDVEIPPPITEEDLMLAVADFARNFAAVTYREVGQRIESDDEVLVDLVAYAAGRVVPMSVKTDVWLDPYDDLLPGVRSALDGSEVGKSHTVKVTFPPTHPLEIFRDKTLIYAVDTKAARALVLPEPDDPELLAALGVESFDDLMGSIAEGLAMQREMEMERRIQFAVSDELQRRLGDVTLDDRIIDAELAARWSQTEGEVLRAKKLSMDDQTHARDAFLKNEGLRAELEHGLRVTMALAAIALDHQVTVTPEAFEALLAMYAEQAGVTSDVVRAQLKEDTSAHQRLGEALLLDAAYRLALSKATVNVIEPLAP